MFYNCIKRVETVPFLTPYCCKLVNLLALDRRISKGSVVTVSRRGGQKYRHLQHKYSRCFTPNVIKIG